MSHYSSTNYYLILYHTPQTICRRLSCKSRNVDVIVLNESEVYIRGLINQNEVFFSRKISVNIPIILKFKDVFVQKNIGILKWENPIFSTNLLINLSFLFVFFCCTFSFFNVYFFEKYSNFLWTLPRFVLNYLWIFQRSIVQWIA